MTAAGELSLRLQAVKIPQARVVLSAVEDTLREQKTEATPTAYFAVVLALLGQSCSPSKGVIKADLATSVVYLLDIITPFVPAGLLRSRFSLVLTHLVPVLTHSETQAPLLRSALGCLQSLLLAQDAAAWALPQNQDGPRRAIVAFLGLAIDQRPKVRKRALEALAKVLSNPPPTPSLDHPAAVMCAELSLRRLGEQTSAAVKGRKQRGNDGNQYEPALIHTLQLVKTIATASGGWPSQNIEPLCQLLLNIAKSSHEYLTVATFEVFEAVFEAIADELSSAKIPRLIEIISQLKPSDKDSHLLPPWIAILCRAYEVYAQVDPPETFRKLPEVFRLLSRFLASLSHNIRLAASEGLVSLLEHGIPNLAISSSAAYGDEPLKNLAQAASELLTVKYQAAWMEVFIVLCALFDAFKSKAHPLLSDVVKFIGDLRANESFQGKKEADTIIGRAVSAMGPEAVLQILPLNLLDPAPGRPGRAWMLPILRDHISNASLGHFRSEFVPLSAAIFQKVIDSGATGGGKTMEIKIFETVVKQIWALLPGYCDLPRDLTQAFDQSWAEQLANVLYKQVDLRADVCKALQSLVDSNKDLLSLDAEAEVLSGVTKSQAQENLAHLAKFANNLLAVLFNVYTETLPQYRGFILTCIDRYLSITSKEDLMSTFTKVVSLLQSSLQEEESRAKSGKPKSQAQGDKSSHMSHTFMVLVITMAAYLPPDSFATLSNVASTLIQRKDDPQLQKKAYKLISRLAGSDTGKKLLHERSQDITALLLRNADKVATPARRDRLQAIARIIEYLPSSDLHFIPSILKEVVISVKEANEKARSAAFELLVAMGEKMRLGGTVVIAKVLHMPPDSPDAAATLEEYFKIVSAGLADTNPHIVSATVTALSQLLFHFRDALPESLMADLVSTLDLFLTSKNREIVQSVLGFVKVCVISLPVPLMAPRLESLVPHLMVWGHEHKARFKAKVKHIIERMIRRFGLETIERFCPAEDRKLITNVRKTRERRKRRKDGEKDEVQDDDDDAEDGRKKDAGVFESEFDEAIYGSEESEDDSEEDDDDSSILGRKRKQRKQLAANGNGPTLVVEDEDDDPVDLLDPRSIAKVSTRRSRSRYLPSAGGKSTRIKAKTDADGKLLLGDDDDDDDDAMALGGDRTSNGVKAKGAEGTGVNAYVEALKSKDAVQRGQRGRLKFDSTQKKRKGGEENDAEDDDKMDLDDDGGAGAGAAKNAKPSQRSGPADARQRYRGMGKPKLVSPGRGGIQAMKSQRRDLGSLMAGTKRHGKPGDAGNARMTPRATGNDRVHKRAAGPATGRGGKKVSFQARRR